MKHLLSALLLCSVVAGCGESKATVHGKVTFNDKPVTAGTVVFTTPDGKYTEHVQIKSDGTYSSATIPMKEVKVGVTPGPKPAALAMPKGAQMPTPSGGSGGYAQSAYGQSASDYVDIPQAFNPNTSGLTLKVDKPDVTYDIPLKDAK